ncbi:MAG: AI-2E family transporter [Candidatus Dojkabacteria bacterium]|nr:AI-2E family transporter [Candidatus Dojkabacteria bacterium]
MHTKQNTTFFFGLFGIVLIASFYVLQPYLSLAVLAFLLTALYSPIYRRLLKVFRFNGIASPLAVFFMFLSILIPIIFISYLTYNQVLAFNDDIQGFVAANRVEEKPVEETKSAIIEIQERLNNTSDSGAVDTLFKVNGEGNVEEVDPNTIGNIDVTDLLKTINKTIDKFPFTESKEVTRDELENFVNDIIKPITAFLADRALELGGSTVKIVTNAIVFVVLLLALFPSHSRIETFYKKISPLADEIDESYIKRITDMGVAMIKGTFIIAFLQGSITGIFLYIAGVDYVFFWSMLATIFSIIPIGSGIVVFPISLVLFLTGNTAGALMLVLTNIFIVGQVDTVLRPRLVPKDAEINPTLVLLSILGGLQLFGVLGFIYGPIVIIILVTTFEVYMRYYSDNISED